MRVTFGPISPGRGPTPRLVIHKDEDLIGIASPDLIHMSDTSAGTAESGLTETTFDTVSDPGSARILLTNSTGATVNLRSAIIRGYPVLRKQAYVHDAFVNRGDIAKNGPRTMTFGGPDVVVADQLNKIAEHKWKEHGQARHVYSITVPGTWHWVYPGERVHITAGSAGMAEYIDSFATVASVRTFLGKEIVTVMIVYETAERFKFNSNAVARFIATGRSVPIPDTITIGTKYSTGYSDVFVPETAAQVLINSVIASLALICGGGTVKLLRGTYNLSAAIEMKSNVTLAGEGAGATIIEKNCNDYAIKAVGSSGNELTNIGLNNFTVTRNASDTNVKYAIYMTYSDNMRVEHITICDPYDAAIYASICARLLINNIYVDAWEGNAAIELHTITTLHLSNIKLDGGGGTNLYGLVIQGCNKANISNVECHNFISSGGVSAYGILVSADNARLVNCEVDNLDNTTDSFDVIGLAFSGNGNQASNIEIEDIDNTNTAASSYGIEVSGDNNTITSSFVRNCSGTGIRIASGDGNQIAGARTTANGTNYADAGTNTGTAALYSA